MGWIRPLVNLEHWEGFVIKRPFVSRWGAPAKGCETASGMLNAIGATKLSGIRNLCFRKLPYWQIRYPLVVNVLATRWKTMSRLFSVLEGKGPAAYELNILPNVKKGEAVRERPRDCGGGGVGCSKSGREKAALGQLSPLLQRLDLFCAGQWWKPEADALTVANTLSAMSWSFGPESSKLGNKTGVFRAPAINRSPEASVGHVSGGESTHPCLGGIETASACWN